MKKNRCSISFIHKAQWLVPACTFLLLAAGALANADNKDAGSKVAKRHAANNKKVKAYLVTGTVTDDKQQPLAHVSVVEKGTKNGVSTKNDGVFSLTVSNEGAVLIFSSVGFTNQEVNVNGQASINVTMYPKDSALADVVVVGYGTKKKAAITAAVSSISAKDLENVHNGATVGAALAGKIPGVTFRMSDGRPGASADVQIRNMGDPLYIIDGIQQDGGQFNNIAPNDIETISVLKDASASIYGVRAANGVVLVTTKRGKLGSRNTINFNGYTGWQNWTRFPKGTNAYEWMLGRQEAEMNQKGKSYTTPEELAKWKAGTEKGYQDFDWYNFIIKKNAPLTQFNLNFSGGSDKINYYVSGTHLKQTSVLGREFTFERTNIQSNIDAKINKSLKIGAQINGRVESRDQPGVPGGDDYWQARFAILRNRPTERAYANDNPLYPQDLYGHNEQQWAVQNKKTSGYWKEDWRVLQTNLNADWQTPLKGLAVRGLFSYYYANKIMNGHEYTYDVFSYDPDKDVYNRTGGSSNPWRERGTETILSPTIQLQANYNRSFGLHTIGATFVNERIKRRKIQSWVHSVPTTNVLPLIYFSTMDTYNDADFIDQDRIGYVGRISYSYDNRYFVDAAARRDASFVFPPKQRWGTFPSISAGWRISQEHFYSKLVNPALLNELKLRASYGALGDDKDLPIGPYDYTESYRYYSSIAILDGQPVIGASYRGAPITNISWFKAKILDIGADFSMFNSKLTGTVDYFKRIRTGLMAARYDVLMPSELGYTLPQENINSDGISGAEFSLAYHGNIKEIQFTVGGNYTYSRPKNLVIYKPAYFNSMDHYWNGQVDRWQGITDGGLWGYECTGQFQSQEQINNYAVNVDGKGNKTLLPGDLIYKDLNGDNQINEYDKRPLGWGYGKNPFMNMGLNIAVNWRGFDMHMDFSGGSGYTFSRNWELRNPFQNEGALNRTLFESRWHREDPFDLNSKWIPGKYPALRFNDHGHSNYDVNSTFWLVNVKYIRCRTLAFGYALPEKLISKAHIQKARFYVNASNLFSIDNTHSYGIDAELKDDNGLTYPQSKFINVGFELSF